LFEEALWIVKQQPIDAPVRAIGRIEADEHPRARFNE
jgi:hypothetical protein